MKKTYKAPETLLTTVALQQMMVNSNNYGKPENGQNLGDDQVETTDATSGNLSRRNSVWNDEEEY